MYDNSASLVQCHEVVKVLVTVIIIIITAFSAHSRGTNRKHRVGQLVRQRRWYAGHSSTEA